jgi:tetratricopeptide (TPR) repeat protein
MTATTNISQEKPPVPSFAESLGIEDDDLDLLEDIFVQATAAKSLPGDKIFAALKRGDSFGKALGISNDMIEFLYARAHRWVAVAQYGRAEPIFRALCIADPSSADFWVALGICLRARSAWGEALAAFETASEKKPQWEIPHFHALDLCVRRKDWAKAATELAAFEKKADNETHSAIVAEVNKYKKALQLQAQRSNGEL